MQTTYHEDDRISISEEITWKKFTQTIEFNTISFVFSYINLSPVFVLKHHKNYKFDVIHVCSSFKYFVQMNKSRWFHIETIIPDTDTKEKLA